MARRLRIDVFCLFPEMVRAPLGESIVQRAVRQDLVTIHIHDLRRWTHDVHRTVDDTPYGGGAGMVMKAPPIVEGVEEIVGSDLSATRVIVTSAGGRRFTQRVAEELADEQRIAIICGHYEGIDARVAQLLHAEEISIGDYVLTGGELAAAVMIDATVRLLPGAIAAQSVAEESHAEDLVEYPHYTRPALYRGLEVPSVLLSGHHAEIARWRREQSLTRTRNLRPDLLGNFPPTVSDLPSTETSS